MLLEKEIIDYKENFQDIKHWVTLKGEVRYEKIINFLQEKGIECSWKNVSSYLRYDKRILFNSFKYLVVLEELYKSFVVREKGKTNTNVWNANFAYAFSEFLKLGTKAHFENINISLMKKEQKSINTFRNYVLHNKILLNRKFNKRNIEEMLKVFVQILPSSYRQGFIDDINGCSKGLVEESWHIDISQIK